MKPAALENVRPGECREDKAEIMPLSQTLSCIVLPEEEPLALSAAARALNTYRTASPALPRLGDLRDFLASRLALPGEAPDEVPLLWRQPSPQKEGDPIRCLAMGLDHRCRLDMPETTVDALFLHRPFYLPSEMMPGIPVLASHHGFDFHLSLGYNMALAETLGLKSVMPLAPDEKSSAIGMVGDLTEPLSWYGLRSLLSREFQGIEMILGNPAHALLTRVAVVGAMTTGLVHQAADAGAQVYLTGQFRPSARAAAEARGMAVVAVGHRRAERWGVRRLVREIGEMYPALEAIVLA